jgi:methyl-accepting chemotaxis protein
VAKDRKTRTAGKLLPILPAAFSFLAIAGGGYLWYRSGSPWDPAWLALLLSLVAASVLSFLVAIRLAALRRRFGVIDEALVGKGEEKADISGLLEICLRTGLVDEVPGLGWFLALLSDDLSLLQRSGTKFDLFASDILFSSRNLANLSESELEMLVRLRERSQAYFTSLSATSLELEKLTEGVRSYAEGAAALRTRALSSNDLLGELSATTSEASEEASEGKAALAATRVSVDVLVKGIRALDAVALRQAAEARRIGEALGVIEDIVERTHLLTTNASIEAAHAGACGAGFAIIAQEIRKLSASSKTALSDIGSVLGSIAGGISESARLATESSVAAGKLGGTMDDSQSRFSAIVERMHSVHRIRGEFSTVFSDQIEAASGLAKAAAEASDRSERFSLVFREGADDYRAIAEDAEKAESGAKDARRSSRVLAQLSGYLKVGGMERNRVLHKYLVAETEETRRFARKESRQLLLYNLEVHSDQGRPLGYLGDLSQSGMLLLTDEEPLRLSRFKVRIVFPLSSEGERSVELSIEVKRVERDSDGIRVGCRFDNPSPSEKRSIDELLSTLSLSSLSSHQVAIPSPAGRGGGGEIAEAEAVEDLIEA